MPSQGASVPSERMAQALNLYYEMNGWDAETGVPTPGKLAELGIAWVTDEIYPHADSGA